LLEQLHSHSRTSLAVLPHRAFGAFSVTTVVNNLALETALIFQVLVDLATQVIHFAGGSERWQSAKLKKLVPRRP